MRAPEFVFVCAMTRSLNKKTNSAVNPKTLIAFIRKPLLLIAGILPFDLEWEEVRFGIEIVSDRPTIVGLDFARYQTKVYNLNKVRSKEDVLSADQEEVVPADGDGFAPCGAYITVLVGNGMSIPSRSKRDLISASIEFCTST